MPFSECIGHGNNLKIIKCDTEEEFKTFIMSDDSLKVYSNFHDIMAASNMYNMNINIFTYGLQIHNPRWTNIVPDKEIGMANNAKLELNLYHSDENHFDLLIKMKQDTLLNRDDSKNSKSFNNIPNDKPKETADKHMDVDEIFIDKSTVTTEISRKNNDNVQIISDNKN